MNFILRQERPSDARMVEELTREAFWNHYAPGCGEHYLAHILRDAPAFVKALDYVAEADGRLVGNIMYTLATVLGDNGISHPVLCFGPVSVLPACQGRGVGTRLIEHTKELAKALGYRAILIYGDPDFYKRVGFVSAESFGIATAGNDYAAGLLACELVPGALTGCAGRFIEDGIYELDPAQVEAFDRSFPPREKQSGLPSQEKLLAMLALQRPRSN